MRKELAFQALIEIQTREINKTPKDMEQNLVIKSHPVSKKQNCNEHSFACLKKML